MLISSKASATLSDRISRENEIFCQGLFLSARWFVASQAVRKGLQLIILPDRESAEYCSADLYNLTEGDTVFHLPESGKKELLALTGLPEYPMDTIRKIRSLLKDSGAVDRTLQKTAGYTDQAMKCLDALPDNSYRRLLTDLTAYMLDREV